MSEIETLYKVMQKDSPSITGRTVITDYKHLRYVSKKQFSSHKPKSDFMSSSRLQAPPQLASSCSSLLPSPQTAQDVLARPQMVSTQATKYER